MHMFYLTTYLFWLFLRLAAPVEPGVQVGKPVDSRINAIDDFTPEELVEDIFVKGACKNILNIRSIGKKEGIGYFENGKEVIGLEEGIILATGPIENIEGPNNERNKSGRFNQRSSDPDLRTMAGSDTIMDAVGLVFDFIPLDSMVTFRYVFASEEYCEYVGDVFNDVFGFFVSGPGIEGTFSSKSENVALIPGTNDFVTINTVNHKINSEYYIGNERRDDADFCGISFSNSEHLNNIQFDGYTRILTATLRLIPCETYTLRLVIADVGDDSYDSAVFLEAESFNIGGAVQLEANTQTAADTLFEGCNEGYFTVSRLDPEQTETPVTIGLRVSEASTAREGIDFKALPKSVTIPAGKTKVDIPLSLIIDEEVEQTESIVLEFDFPCACISDTARLLVRDPPLMGSGLEDQLICIGETTTLEAQPAGGVPSYRFRWSTGAETQKIQVTPEQDKTYQLTITDDCGRQLIDEVSVKLRVPPQLQLPDRLIERCVGDTATFVLGFSGEPPYRFSYAVGGISKGEITGIMEDTYKLRVDQEGAIEVFTFSDAICEGRVVGESRLRYYRIQSLATVEKVSCSGEPDGAIRTQVVGGTEPYVYDWGGKAPPIPNPTELPAGYYELTITDANNCFTTVGVTIPEPSPLKGISFDCRDFSSGTLSFGASGGTPPYLYSIDNGVLEDRTIFDHLIGGQQYHLTIQDAFGCEITQDFTMPVAYEKMVELPTAIKLTIGQKTVLQPQLNIPMSLVNKITWTPSNNLSCDDCLNPELLGLQELRYTIRIDDIFGCVGASSMVVRLDKQPSLFVPSAFSPDGDGRNDLLVIYANEEQISSIESLLIFNRWGAIVYRAQNFLPNDQRASWDGTFKGTHLDPGTFTYLLKALMADGTPIHQEGVVHLIK